MNSILIAGLLFCAAGVQNVSAFGTSSSSTVVRSTGSRLSSLDMKIFDYKKRKEFENFQIPDDYVLSVNTISAIPGSRKRFLRVGRGISAGQGASCGRGMRGQKSRSGEGRGTRPGFEGGQTPLYRRLPKINKPQKGHEYTNYKLVKLDMLNSVPDGSEVNFQKLFEMGVVTKANKGIEIFKLVGGTGETELTAKDLTVRAHAFTASARAAVEAAGGKCVVLSPTRHIPIEEAIADQEKKDAERLVKLKALRVLKRARDAAKISA